MDIDNRIAQWEKMTREAPDAMAWFSLGNAYREAGQLEQAANAFGEALKLDAGLSRAWQWRGQVLIQLDRNEEAGAVLTLGYTTAAARGDVMPQRAMESLLRKLGLPVPAVASVAGGPAPVAGADQIICRRTGQPGTRMKDPPMRGPLGRFIAEHYSLETWREWLRMGTKVINELRLDFQIPAHSRIYDQHMMEWLGISEEEVER